MSEIIGFNEIYKNKRTTKIHVAIDSKQRDKTINSKNKTYSDPNDYQIVVNKYKKLKNVICARVVEAMIPNSEYIINNNNKYLDIIFDGTLYYITLEPGNYTFSSLGVELVEKITNETPTSVTDWTIVLNNTDTFLTTITHNSKEFVLLFETGTNADCSIASVLGFAKKDVESKNVSGLYTITSDYPYHLNSTKYVDIKIDEIPDIGTTLDVREDLQTQILKRIPIDVEFGKEAFYQSGDGDKNYNYFSPIELSKLNIKLFNDSGKIYDSNRIDNYFILELILLSDDAPDNSELLPLNIKEPLKETFENEKKNIIKQNLASDNLLDNNSEQDNVSNIENSSTNINDLKDISINDLDTSNHFRNETNIKDLNLQNNKEPIDFENIDNEDKNVLNLNEITDENISKSLNSNKTNLVLTIGNNNYDIYELFDENKNIIILILIVIIIFMVLGYLK